MKAQSRRGILSSSKTGIRRAQRCTQEWAELEVFSAPCKPEIRNEQQSLPPTPLHCRVHVTFPCAVSDMRLISSLRMSSQSENTVCGTLLGRCSPLGASTNILGFKLNTYKLNTTLRSLDLSLFPVRTFLPHCPGSLT